MTTISTSASSFTPLLNYGSPRLAYGTTPLTHPTLLALPRQETEGLQPSPPPSLSPTPTATTESLPLLQAASTSQQTLNQEALSQLNQQWLQQLPPATPPATATNPPASSSDTLGEVTQCTVTKKFQQDFPVANEGELEWRRERERRERQRIAFKKEINNQHAKFMKNQQKEAELIAKAKAKADADQYTEGSADATA